jgi:hypothetical protein
MENKDMAKELKDFESEIKSGQIKDILYKPDYEMEGLIRLDFLKEKYGEILIGQILSENNILISDVSNQDTFLKICKIAES